MAAPERSAGVVLFRARGGRRQFLLVRSRRHGSWGFPKGHVRPGESDEAAARRELREETGLTAGEFLPGFRRALRYRLPGGGAQKEAVYFLARCIGEAAERAAPPAPPDAAEIAELRWSAPDEALRLIPFPDARECLEAAAARLPGAAPAAGRRVDYDRIAERYERTRRLSPELGSELAAALPAGFRPGRALDAGCGTGGSLACLRRAWPGARSVGLDASAGMLAVARRKEPAAALVRADAARLPFAAGSFELVFAAYLLHHLPGPGEFFAEAARVLAGGGRLAALTAGHEQIRAHFLNRFFPRFAELDCARFPDLERCGEELARAGLVPESRREVVAAEYPLDRSYLELVRARHVSTLELLEPEEFAAGLARLEEQVRAHRGPEESRPRHRVRAVLLVARKGS